MLGLAGCGSPSGAVDAPDAATAGPDLALSDAGIGSDLPVADAALEDGGSPPPTCVVDPYPSPLRNPEALAMSEAELRFQARDGNELVALTHRSPSFDPETGPILFVIHGSGRNSTSYLRPWRELVDAAGALAIAPNWPSSLYDGSEAFTLGVGTDAAPRGPTYDPAEWRASDDYTYSEVEHLFEAVREELGNTSCAYDIYGHSAGGQFVHRLVTFRPDARIRTAVAANAGWYTLPGDGGGDDPNYYVPYGLQGAPPIAGRRATMFEHRLVVLLGEEDTLRDDDLRQNEQADHQGQNRLERGRFYFDAAQEAAVDLDVPFRWVLDTVPSVGHQSSEMTPAAAGFIFEP
jgi:hypothetical protein